MGLELQARSIADEAREPTLDIMMRARDSRWKLARPHPPPGRTPGNTTSTYELRQGNPALAIRAMSQT